MAHRSTFTTAWVRYWKKASKRPRDAGATSTCARMYISTSSRRTSVDRPSSCGFDSNSANNGSAGGVSLSLVHALRVDQPETIGASQTDRPGCSTDA